MIEDARNKITELIERFHRNSEVYRSGNYNETQVRREFIDPFFDALGWDVANKAGYAEQYKDVVHEDSIKVGVSLKAPDYSFRIGGQRKFFLEAKKPQVKIKEDVGPAYQLRRYAWSAKLPLSIVTDFEEFAVYDCRVKPDPSDKVSHGRIAYYTYDQYLEKFDEIYETFSKDAVLKGSFDRYIESSKGKKGTGEVDREFLKEIEKWRDSLARNLALRNPELDIYELNFAVQHTIDRIIFLRICEDRGIEGYGRLQGLLNGASVYERLLHLFTQADKKYNSGLFDFKADRLSHNLNIDDKVLKEIIENLYYPKSPYEFSVLGADILGNVYEQFLGKVIRLTAGHQAKVEEKPEGKKAGGVYYTPQYIVEYIVKNTVGRLLGDGVGIGAGLPRPRQGDLAPTNQPVGANLVFAQGLVPAQGLAPAQKGRSQGSPLQKMTPKDVAHIRILDPACGSGSFLIGAYQYLLDWHIKWYAENEPEKHAKGKTPAIYQGAGKAWRLTTQEKKRILLNNIYGVDIDRQAVEVTKLSLLLKLLEDENQETVGKTLALFQERVLPSLENNIKCGNSLIGPDFYNQMELNVGAGARRPELGVVGAGLVFAQGLAPAKKGRSQGSPLQDDEIRRINVFDWKKEFPEIMKSGGFDAVIGNPPYGYMIPQQEQQYFSAHYQHQDYQKDLYLLFLERYEYILRNGGLLGVIVSNTWLQSVTLRKVREYLTMHYQWQQVLHLPEKVFRAVVDTHVLIFKRANTEVYAEGVLSVDIRQNGEIRPWHTLSWAEIPKNGDPINVVVNSEAHRLFRKIRDESVMLKKLCNVYNGIKPFEKGKGNPPQTEQVLHEKPYLREGAAPAVNWSPLLRGSLIQRYLNLWNSDYWVLYGPWLAAPRDPEIFNSPQLCPVRELHKFIC